MALTSNDSSAANDRSGSSLNQDAAYERGRSDALKGIPPREGTTRYLEGYAAEDNPILRKPFTAAAAGGK